MPFKNNEDKKVWRRAYRMRYKERHEAWTKRYEARPWRVADKAKRKEINDERTRASEIRRDADCLGKVMRQLRRDIMKRDGLKQCSACKIIKPILKIGSGHNSWCRKCSAKYQRRWRREHLNEKIVRGQIAYARVKADPVKLVRQRIRGRLSKAMKRYARGATTTGSRLRYLGCTAQQACAYIEQQFKKGMDWNNYGKHGWEIDHVSPLAAFDLSDEDHRRKAFHYTNLQPLWAIDNQRKNDRMLDVMRQPLLLMPVIGTRKASIFAYLAMRHQQNQT